MVATTVLSIDYIVKTPNVCGGRARIDGTRLTVELLITQLQSGATIDELIDGYDHIPLTRAQIHAALAYYYDNQAEIDGEIAATDKAFEELKRDAADFEAALADTSLIPSADAAKRLGLSPQSNQLASLCRDGKLNCRKVANRWFVTVASVEEYARSNRKPGPK
jgi:uncharacterized protein (DUF433 family)